MMILMMELNNPQQIMFLNLTIFFLSHMIFSHLLARMCFFFPQSKRFGALSVALTRVCHTAGTQSISSSCTG